MTDEEIVREALNQLIDLGHSDEARGAHAAFNRLKREMAMQSIADFGQYQDWIEEKSRLTAELARKDAALRDADFSLSQIEQYTIGLMIECERTPVEINKSDVLANARNALAVIRAALGEREKENGAAGEA